MILDWYINKVPTVLGLITGIVAGLVGITPASGFVTAPSAIVIGSLASITGFFFITKVKEYFKYDDSLDVFAVHGMCGIVGAIATGIFATKSINPDGANGLLYGGGSSQLLVQLLTVLVAIVFSAVGTLILLKITDLLVGLRVTKREENIGLDLTQHHEVGYTLID